MNARDLLAGQTWAMPGREFGNWIRQIDSMAALLAKGIGTIDKGMRAAFAENTIVPEINAQGMAHIELIGVALNRVPFWAFLMGAEVFSLADAKETVDALAQDNAVAGLTITMDTPGGSVTGTAELAAALLAFRATGKTVHIKAQGMLASSGYWIASAANSIEWTPGTIGGAIGVYNVLADTSAADEAAGIKYVTVASGGVKGAGADGKVTDELIGVVRQIVDQSAQQFIADVAANRALDLAAVKALATGAVWFAAEAQGLGLIDAITYPAGVSPSPTTANGPTGAVIAPTPIAASVAEGSRMKILAPALATLCAAFAADVPAVIADAQAGLDEAQIRTNAETRKSAALVKAKDDRITELSAQVAAAQAETAAAKAAHDVTKTELATAKDDLAKAKGFIPKHKDVGAGGTGASEKSAEELAAMTPVEKAAHYAAADQAASK